MFRTASISVFVFSTISSLDLTIRFITTGSIDSDASNRSNRQPRCRQIETERSDTDVVLAGTTGVIDRV